MENRELDKAALALECPICGIVRKPIRFNRDDSISYACPPDHLHHGTKYTWRILVDGTLVD